MTFLVLSQRATKIILSLAIVSSSYLLNASSLMAAPAKKGLVTKTKIRKDKDFKTEHSFRGADVTGQYKSAPEGVVTVDADKSLDDLLKMRPHFKDYAERLSEQR